MISELSSTWLHLVSEATALRFRSELPKTTDAVASALDLVHDFDSGESVEMLITDVQDAFWLLPDTMRERRFMCTVLLRLIIVFLRKAQGGRNASLAFCTFIALAARLVQSLFFVGAGLAKRSSFYLLL